MTQARKRITVVALVVAAAVGVVALKSSRRSEGTDKTTATPTPHGVASPGSPEGPAKPKALPRLLELGSTTCTPCKKMAPILDELKTEYPGKLQVDFTDVYADTSAADRYDIKIIPTQIFFDAEGKELYRHTGFFPKEEILAKFGELGIALDAQGRSAGPAAPQ